VVRQFDGFSHTSFSMFATGNADAPAAVHPCRAANAAPFPNMRIAVDLSNGRASPRP
jgi:hypothetical protein